MLPGIGPIGSTASSNCWIHTYPCGSKVERETVTSADERAWIGPITLLVTAGAKVGGMVPAPDGQEPAISGRHSTDLGQDVTDFGRGRSPQAEKRRGTVGKRRGQAERRRCRVTIRHLPTAITSSWRRVRPMR